MGKSGVAGNPPDSRSGFQIRVPDQGSRLGPDQVSLSGSEQVPDQVSGSASEWAGAPESRGSVELPDLVRMRPGLQ